MDPDERERRERERKIQSLKDRAGTYGPAVDASVDKLEKYQKDFDNYQEKLKLLESAGKLAISGNEQLGKGQGSLQNNASGFKYNWANSLFNRAKALSTDVSVSGIEAIKIYIMKDLEKLVQDYENEYKIYETNINAYNGFVSELRSYSVFDFAKKEVTITKAKLI